MSANADLLGYLAVALSRLEGQLRAQAAAAQGFAVLVERAERIAAMASGLARHQRRAPSKDVAVLTRELGDFVAEVHDLAAHAANVATIGQEVAERLGGHCAHLGRIAQTSGDRAALRAELARLTETIAAFPARGLAEEAIGTQISALSEAAARLGEQARQISARPHALAQIVLGISHELRGFAADAAQLSATLTRHTSTARSAVQSMAVHAQALATDRPGSAATGASGRLSDMVRQGYAAAQVASARAAPEARPPGPVMCW